MAAMASENRFILRHSSMNCRQTVRIASPSCLRKSAIVLQSGIRRPVNQISSTIALRFSLQPPARLNPIQDADPPASYCATQQGLNNAIYEINLAYKNIRLEFSPKCSYFAYCAMQQISHQYPFARSTT